jgi:hypothetical protein
MLSLGKSLTMPLFTMPSASMWNLIGVTLFSASR